MDLNDPCKCISSHDILLGSFDVDKLYDEEALSFTFVLTAFIMTSALVLFGVSPIYRLSSV